MKGRSSPVAMMGVLAGLTAALQLGPVWWPGAGFLLAMAATLPVFVGAALHPERSPWLLFSAGVVTALFSLQEMAVLLTMTGPLGLALGVTIRRPRTAAVPAAAGVLTLGMLLLPVLAGVHPWGGLERFWAFPVKLAAYLLFALAYAYSWRILCRKLYRHLAPALATRYTKVDMMRKGDAGPD